MSAVIEFYGKQYTVNKGDVIAVDKIDKKEKEKIEIDKVLVTNEKDNVNIGSPYIANAKVEAKIIEHVRDEKVHVFKYKRRKNYKKLKGHKQPYTMIKIEKITVK